MDRSYLLINCSMEQPQPTAFFEALARLSSSASGSVEITSTSTMDISDLGTTMDTTELQKTDVKLIFPEGVAPQTDSESSILTSNHGEKMENIFSLFPSPEPSPDSTKYTLRNGLRRYVRRFQTTHPDRLQSNRKA